MIGTKKQEERVKIRKVGIHWLAGLVRRLLPSTMYHPSVLLIIPMREEER